MTADFATPLSRGQFGRGIFYFQTALENKNCHSGGYWEYFYSPGMFRRLFDYNDSGTGPPGNYSPD